ncbi:hypothetical protein D8674_009642 [Pyrus ussuriensis x Pyrus communis]|uniref:Uncharacterized protein n=1 Tax=Pyrus ussuriensis x Pyrus communis TaxID=2448454 RepID=A0A5N5FBX3_9ROSA|nr:hypothetical protein D8674_009642 [Pyrus ussuriensis x Pyrus communis]
MHHLKSQREGIIDGLINESLDGLVADGTFLEEPGSSAVPTIENKKDQIRVDAGQVVKSLSKQGIDVYMLSGDKSNNAEYVAFVVGIPKEKLLDALELSRLTMKQNLDVQSSNPDAIT